MSGAPYFNGKFDDVRYSNIDRSADWLKLEYYSMKKTNYNGDNDGTNKFITFGSQGATVPSPVSATFKGFVKFMGSVMFK